VRELSFENPNNVTFDDSIILLALGHDGIQMSWKSLACLHVHPSPIISRRYQTYIAPVENMNSCATGRESNQRIRSYLGCRPRIKVESVLKLSCDKTRCHAASAESFAKAGPYFQSPSRQPLT